jgi:MFS family permease
VSVARSHAGFTRINLLGVTFITAWHTTLPFVAVYAQSLGASAPVIGLMISSTVLLPLVLGIYIGAAVDSLGVTRVAQWSAVLFALACAVMAAGSGLWILTIALGIVGFADVGLVVASQTYVASYSLPSERDRNFGFYTIWVSLGALIGPILGGLLADTLGYRAVFAGSFLLGLVTIGICATLPRGPAARPAASTVLARQTAASAATMLRDRALVLVLLVNACAMFAFSLRQSFYPVYLQSVGFSTTLIGAAFSFHSLCSIAVRPTIGKAVERLGHPGVLAMAIGLTAAGVSVTPLLRNPIALTAAIGLTGIATGYMQPLSMSLISGRAKPAARGVALGLRISMNQLSQAVGPPLLGLAVAGYGLPAAFYLAALVVCAGFPVLARMERRAGAGQDTAAADQPAMDVAGR